MATTTIRVSKETREALRELSSELGEPIQTVLAKAIESYQRLRFIEGANQDFDRLRENAEGWGDELAERELWASASPEPEHDH